MEMSRAVLTKSSEVKSEAGPSNSSMKTMHELERPVPLESDRSEGRPVNFKDKAGSSNPRMEESSTELSESSKVESEAGSSTSGMEESSTELSESSKVESEAGSSTSGMCDGVNDDVNADHQVQATIKGSLKAAAAAGGLVLVGAIVFGPPGIALGGAVGTVWGCWKTWGKFKPLYQVLRKRSPQ